MPLLFARQNPLEDAKNTISSWDNCMAESYCKWPVIVGIIIGTLILISVVTCIARCICCGAECACCCFRCCTCCCSGRRDRSSHQRMKSEPAAYPAPAPYAGGVQPSYATPSPAANPYAQAHAVAPRPSMDTRPVNEQYRSNAMPTFAAANAPERPQFAKFDSTRPAANEDALPAMPTWKDGRDVHVAVEEAVPEKKGDVELNRLNRNGSMASGGSGVAMAAVGGAGAGMRKSPGPARSPGSTRMDDYGFPPGYQNQNDGYASAAVPPRMSPGPQRGPYAQQDEYQRASPGAHASPVHGRADAYGQHQHANQQYGRQSPGQHQAYDSYEERDHYNPHNQYDDRGQHSQYNHPNYHDDSNHGYNSPAPPPQQQYNDRHNSPAPPPPRYEDDRYNSPAPPPQHVDRYNSPAPPSQPMDRYNSPAPPPQPMDRYASPAPPQQVDYSSPAPPPQFQPHHPYHPPSESTIYELPSEPSIASTSTPTPSVAQAPAYPGQQKYGESTVYPGQQTYQAFQPGSGSGGAGVRRAEM
ncbi:hypothetical protein J1614_004824 [Plenodomus biglobosus]|nr:hypothetical protein J1614_004824 [Plenodomus biglobosus]